jgi:hypothetical protein
MLSVIMLNVVMRSVKLLLNSTPCSGRTVVKQLPPHSEVKVSSPTAFDTGGLNGPKKNNYRVTERVEREIHRLMPK